MSWRMLKQRTAVWRSMRAARKKATRKMLNYYAARRAIAVLHRMGVV